MSKFNHNNIGTSAPQDSDLKFRPLEVVVDGTCRDDFEFAMKKFKSLFQKEGVLGYLKNKSAFEKPSDKKRRKIRDSENRKRIADYKERLVLSGQWDKIQQDKVKKKMQKDEKRAKERLEESQ
jgi:ribosomal protein S21